MSRLIVITGAGRGLGLSLAQRHLAQGDRVWALEWKPTEELTALEKSYPEALKWASCDISSTESVNQACAPILAQGETIGILYNVAGIYLQNARHGLMETDLDEGLPMYDINGVGLLRVCKALFPLLGEGSLVANITSEAGSITNCYRDGEYMYCISKAAANMASKLLSNELYPKGARVICFHPGWLRTQIGGANAYASPNSIDPSESAAGIMSVTDHIDTIPPSWLFMDYQRNLLPW